MIRYTAKPEFDLGDLNRAYSDAMKGLLAKYPTDDERVNVLGGPD